MSDVIPNGGGIPQDGSPPGHLDKMLKMDDGQQEPKEGDQQAASPTPRPENIPEKFWNAEKGEVNIEALLKAQADAEAALRKTQQKPEDGSDDAPSAQDVQDSVVDAASAEFAEKGELSAETFAALEKVGISRQMVDSYIAGQQAIIGKIQDAAYGPFNGKDGYEAAADWAAANLSDAEIKALDVQLTSTNPEVVAQGAKALLERYQKGADIEPGAIRGTGNDTSHGGSYKSSREMMKDMASNRYRTDASFRKEVMEKIGRSPNL